MLYLQVCVFVALFIRVYPLIQTNVTIMTQKVKWFASDVAVTQSFWWHEKPLTCSSDEGFRRNWSLRNAEQAARTTLWPLNMRLPPATMVTSQKCCCVRRKFMLLRAVSPCPGKRKLTTFTSMFLLQLKQTKKNTQLFDILIQTTDIYTEKYNGVCNSS